MTNGLSLPFLGESMVFDPKTNAVAYNAQSYLLNGVASRKTFDQSLGGNNYRIKARFAKTPAPAGLIYIFKGPNRSNRLAPAIHLTNSRIYIWINSISIIQEAWESLQKRVKTSILMR